MFWTKKVIWITGASSGIGRSLSILLSKKDTGLILSGRNTEALESVRKLCANQEQVHILPLDLEITELLDQKVYEAIGFFGHIDILINNAGISQRSLALETKPEVLDKILATNLTGTIKLSQAILPHFNERKTGQYVVLSSIAGFLGLPYRTAYSASKHALEGYFSALRTEVWNNNIDITIIRPGAVNTNIARNALTNNGEPYNATDKLIENGLSPTTLATRIIKATEQKKHFKLIGSFKEKVLYAIYRISPTLAFHIIKSLKN